MCTVQPQALWLIGNRQIEIPIETFIDYAGIDKTPPHL
jgi:hypothetical protein